MYSYGEIPWKIIKFDLPKMGNSMIPTWTKVYMFSAFTEV